MDTEYIYQLRSHYTLRMGQPLPDEGFWSTNTGEQMSDPELCRGFGLRAGRLYEVYDFVSAIIESANLQHISTRSGQGRLAFEQVGRDMAQKFPELTVEGNQDLREPWATRAWWIIITNARHEAIGGAKVKKRVPREFAIQNGKIESRPKVIDGELARFWNCTLEIQGENKFDRRFPLLRWFLVSGDEVPAAGEDIDPKNLRWEKLLAYLKTESAFDSEEGQVLYTAADVTEGLVDSDVSLHNAVVRMRWDAAERVGTKDFSQLGALNVTD